MKITASQEWTIPTIPTCEDEAEILLTFSVLIMINIIFKYISIIY